MSRTYKGPLGPMRRVDDAQLASVTDYHAFVGLQCADGWSLSQIALGYRLRGLSVAQWLEDGGFL